MEEREELTRKNDFTRGSLFFLQKDRNQKGTKMVKNKSSGTSLNQVLEREKEELESKEGRGAVGCSQMKGKERERGEIYNWI